MGYTSFEDLEVWKRSARLAVKTYDVLGDCRDYGLKDQMTSGRGLHRLQYSRGGRKGQPV